MPIKHYLAAAAVAGGLFGFVGFVASGCDTPRAGTQDVDASTQSNADKETDVYPLEPHSWKSRPVVIFAPGRDDETYREQMAHLKNNMEGVRERDIVVFHIFSRTKGFGPDGPISDDGLRRLWDRFQPADPFTVILVGKDTTEKLRQSEVLTAESLFKTIDAMPMRQREMSNSP
jgi:hypothetical protein